MADPDILSRASSLANGRAPAPAPVPTASNGDAESDYEVYSYYAPVAMGESADALAPSARSELSARSTDREAPWSNAPDPQGRAPAGAALISARYSEYSGDSGSRPTSARPRALDSARSGRSEYSNFSTGGDERAGSCARSASMNSKASYTADEQGRSGSGRSASASRTFSVSESARAPAAEPQRTASGVSLAASSMAGSARGGDGRSASCGSALSKGSYPNGDAYGDGGGSTRGVSLGTASSRSRYSDAPLPSSQRGGEKRSASSIGSCSERDPYAAGDGYANYPNGISRHLPPSPTFAHLRPPSPTFSHLHPPSPTF